MAEVMIGDIRKSYRTVEVIHSLNIDIAGREFLALVEPSGGNKSTLLRMIAGPKPINGGTIAIGDRVVNNLPPAEPEIAMDFHISALCPHKSFAENMGFELKVANADKSKTSRQHLHCLDASCGQRMT